MSKPFPTLRPLSPAEIVGLPGLWAAAGLAFDAEGRDRPEALEQQRCAAPELWIGAFDGERLVGFVLGSDDGRKGWINRLAVLPEWRRRGLARRLVEACEGAIGRRGRTVFGALVTADNTASLELFRDAGYALRSDISYLRKPP